MIKRLACCRQDWQFVQVELEAMEWQGWWHLLNITPRHHIMEYEQKRNIV
jgi:hypothetical protein